MTPTHLNEAQIAELRAALEAAVSTLGGDIENERAEARAGADALRESGAHDRGEESSTASQTEVDRTLLEQHEGERRAVLAALARMDEGRYGECVSCGEPIGFPRLRAAPATVRCLACQSNAEHG